MPETQTKPVELLLIRSDPPCGKCRKADALLDEVAAAQPGTVTVRVITTADAEAMRYGAVLTPMVVLNGKIVCAGLVPVRSGLEKLIAAEAARP